jgi:hypothetical protein
MIQVKEAGHGNYREKESKSAGANAKNWEGEG